MLTSSSGYMDTYAVGKKQYRGREGKTRTRMVSRATETSEA